MALIMFQRMAVTLLLACAACSDDDSFGGAGLRGDSVAVAAGETVRLCVELRTGGELVAATQNDLRWDPSCVTLVGACAVEPATGKQLMSNQRAPGDLRTIVISLQDVNPIPAGRLYCCSMRPEVNSGCCPVHIVAAHGSDPAGRALSMSASDGEVCVQ
jgi:hypothetical protein